jgi:hypothetical protein
MRGRLRLDYDGVTVLLAAAVAEHVQATGAGVVYYRWEGPLRDYDHHPGCSSWTTADA